MLSQLKKLSVDMDGRYANDIELNFLIDYAKSYDLRLRTYRKLSIAEKEIVQQVEQRLKSLDPKMLADGGQDLTRKWRQDTIRVLRQSSAALLTNDLDGLRDGFLLWFQSIMKAFRAQRSCEATYTIMQSVIQKHLTIEEAELFLPILEMNRTALGSKI